jgi:hypothetical protein
VADVVRPRVQCFFEARAWSLTVRPDFRRETKCISYVRQDQVTHI